MGSCGCEQQEEQDLCSVNMGQCEQWDGMTESSSYVTKWAVRHLLLIKYILGRHIPILTVCEGKRDL